MERTSGWYARKVRFTLLATGTFLTTLLNTGSVQLGKTLWEDPQLRDQIAKLARKIAEVR